MSWHVIHYRHLRLYTIQTFECGVVVTQAIQLLSTHKVRVHTPPRRRESDASALDQSNEPRDLLFIVGQYRGRSFGPFQPFVNLPDTFDGPTKVRIGFGSADDLVDVTSRAFANSFRRIHETKIIMTGRYDVDSFDRTVLAACYV